ncbi:MAG: FkbM family methyltransferase [Methanoregula sp.]|nr:FkbM family methyltransferase [Methanoregula sp.]
MINSSHGYFYTVLSCLKEGKFKGAFLRGTVPVIILASRYTDQVKYRLLKFRNRKRGHEIIVEINNRYNMYLDLDDKGVCSELGINKTREVFSTGYFQRIITEDMAIIDIGANIGYYALLESQLAKKGHVYAIEPVPENYNLLQKNIDLNACKNISTYNFAIGNVNGFLDMYVYEKCNWSSFTRIPDENIVNIIQVPIMTLDTFIESHVSAHPCFIRMDVEGFEYEILKGALITLRTAGPLIICIEMHPRLMSEDKVAECIQLMKDNRFCVKSIFLEMDNPSDFKYIHLINTLKNILHLPLYGYYGNDFGSLQELLGQGYFPIVFFEKSV